MGIITVIGSKRIGMTKEAAEISMACWKSFVHDVGFETTVPSFPNDFNRGLSPVSGREIARKFGDLDD